MTESEYAPRPAAVVIERRRSAAGISVRTAAKAAGLSEGRWRQIAKGYQRAAKGVDVPVNAPDATLARMAIAVGATRDEMVLADEQGVADEMYDQAAPHQGLGYILSLSEHDRGLASLQKWLAENGDATSTHPPAEALALWTPAQLASALSAQVERLEKEFLVQLRRNFGRGGASSDLAFDVDFAAHLTESRVGWVVPEADGSDEAEAALPAQNGRPIEYADPDDVDPEDYVLAASDADHDPEVEAWQEEP